MHKHITADQYPNILTVTLTLSNNYPETIHAVATGYKHAHAPYVIINAQDIFPIPSGFIEDLQFHLSRYIGCTAELAVVVTKWHVVKHMFQFITVPNDKFYKRLVFSPCLAQAQKTVYRYDKDRIVAAI